ncbi:MAG: ABC transporter permease subunit [Ornithinimicrobium sp.]
MNSTIARLSAQSLLGQRRFILLGLLPVLLLLLSVVTVALTDGSVAVEPITMVFGFGLVLPLIALLVTNGVLGPEIEDGSIIYLLSKPISRYVVVTSKFAVAAAMSVGMGAGSVFLSALLLDLGDPGQALAIGLGGAAAALGYCGLFLALATVTRHGTIAGLIYVLGFEGLLASWLGGLQYISVGSFGRRVVASIHDDIALVNQDMSVLYVVGALTIVTIGGVALAGYRLRSFEVRGED